MGGILCCQGKVYKPAADVSVGPDSEDAYVETNVKVPRVAGLLVKLLAWILECRIIGPLVIYKLMRDNLLHKIIRYADVKDSPLFTPTHPWEDHKEQEITQVKQDLSPDERVHKAVECLHSAIQTTLDGSTSALFHRWTIMDFSRAYSSGETTPLLVAKRFITAVQDSSQPHLRMSIFTDYNIEDILKQAKQSTLRYEKGSPISALDGILVAVKDEIDCLPYPTTGGTRWLHKFRPCSDDASCVKSLRRCGAILVGKTNMHELGVGISGINPHYGVARNPFDPNKIAGGSSSGSAASVCAGLCPVALGVDGGGSVRIPAALCGVVGMKPTYGRWSHDGVLPLNWTLGNVGILAGTVEDAFIVYAALSDGHLPNNSPSIQPDLHFPLLKFSTSVSNIRLGKYDKWFNDCREDIRECCDNALGLLCMNYGWKVVDITVPELEDMRLAHYLTIGSELFASFASHLDKLNKSEVGWDARVALQFYAAFSSKDYLNAQRHREIFKSVDVIVTPTTGVTAYPIQEDALKTGELDYINGAALLRFAIAGNFLGLPALTIMVGYDKGGMPIGFQLIGRPWSEATLLHLAYAIQELHIKNPKKPKVYFDLLGNQ